MESRSAGVPSGSFVFIAAGAAIAMELINSVPKKKVKNLRVMPIPEVFFKGFVTLAKSAVNYKFDNFDNFVKTAFLTQSRKGRKVNY
jgi:hypothetical protein